MVSEGFCGRENKARKKQYISIHIYIRSLKILYLFILIQSFNEFESHYVKIRLVQKTNKKRMDSYRRSSSVGR